LVKKFNTGGTTNALKVVHIARHTEKNWSTNYLVVINGEEVKVEVSVQAFTET